jgi:hypothetical protein
MDAECPAPLSSDLLNATFPGAPGHYQPPILGAGEPLLLTVAVLAGHTAVFLLATCVLLKHQVGGVSLTGFDAWLRSFFSRMKPGRRGNREADAPDS